MKLLLDTVVFLDAVLRPQDLSARARGLLLDADNERYLSIVSSWEIVVKYSLGKLALPADPQFFIPEHRNRLATDLLHLDEESVLQIPRLPPVHRDPFDRILVSQALVHGMMFVTPDTRIAQYPVRIAW
ncbi:MAG TPA: type II toxin-antitoxin system VapC family toxin [Terriglobia bacterium]|nr:type II toxin-antitoxin system VapC family toxin [Terriglobia bacterium]